MDDISRQKISHIITAFETYALGDIRNVQQHQMPIAAFILCVCFIDQISGFIYDHKLKGQKTSTERSKKFVSDYLNNVALRLYDRDDIIDLLRNKLVHNYSLSDRKKPKHQKYVLEYENPQLHLHQEDDKVVINILGFINDLENAFKLYKSKVFTDSTLLKNAINQYDEYGILVHKEITISGL